MSTDIALTLPAIGVTAETTFTVTRLREFVTSERPDAVLQTYLDAAQTAIDRELGPLTVHEHMRVSGDLLMLSRPADIITTVVEDARSAALTLAADDYELSDSGLVLRRLTTGTNAGWRWSGQVDVTYVRKDDADARISVAVALVQLDLTRAPGLAGQKIGTWEETYSANSVMNYQVERRLILASLTDDAGSIR